MRFWRFSFAGAASGSRASASLLARLASASAALTAAGPAPTVSPGEAARSVRDPLQLALKLAADTSSPSEYFTRLQGNSRPIIQQTKKRPPEFLRAAALRLTPPGGALYSAHSSPTATNSAGVTRTLDAPPLKVATRPGVLPSVRAPGARPTPAAPDVGAPTAALAVLDS
jgi:hypothetical protein